MTNPSTVDAGRPPPESAGRAAGRRPNRRGAPPYAGPVDDIATELRRVSRRWHELPAEAAQENAAMLRALAQELADATRVAAGRERFGA